MKKTEWYYDQNKKHWWMVTVATNSNQLPTLTLPEAARKRKATIRNIDLADDNKRLWRLVYGLSITLGAAMGAVVFLLAT